MLSDWSERALPGLFCVLIGSIFVSNSNGGGVLLDGSNVNLVSVKILGKVNVAILYNKTIILILLNNENTITVRLPWIN